MALGAAEPEIVVAGAGLAGLTAGFFAARSGRSVVVLTGDAIGGHLLSVTRVDDFPGLAGGVAGYELCPLVEEQAAAAGADIRAASVLALEQDGGAWLVRTSEGDCLAGAVIVATGSRFRELGVPGEARLLGKGVSHCASCDARLFRGRKVAVVGGGDSALQEALELADHASEVVILHNRETFTAQAVYRERVAEHRAIGIRAPLEVEEIIGEEAVEAVRVRDLAAEGGEVIEVAGVFVYIGLTPRTELLAGLLQLEPSGHVVTDGSMRTALPGLLAAGDIRRDSARQAVAAAGDGATAAIAADRYLADGIWIEQPAAAAPY